MLSSSASTTNLDVVREARRFLTSSGGSPAPFRHQGRQPAVGIDCIGLVVLAARAAGLPCGDFTRYGRKPNPRVLLAEMAKSARIVDCPQLGDIVLMQRRRDMPMHAGILTPPLHPGCEFFLIHTNADVKRVTEEPYAGAHIERTHSFWRLLWLP